MSILSKQRKSKLKAKGIGAERNAICVDSMKTYTLESKKQDYSEELREKAVSLYHKLFLRLELFVVN